MKFDVSLAAEVLSATPRTIRELLGKLSADWTKWNSDMEFRTAHLASAEYQRDPSGQQMPDRPWTPFDVVGHLIHGEETDWIPRARIIIVQGNDRTFVPFDRFAQFEKSKGRSLLQLLEEFAALRSENLDTLCSWNLTDRELDLQGVHPELGPVTLKQLLATWIVHDLNHIRQIVTIMARRYDSEVRAVARVSFNTETMKFTIDELLAGLPLPATEKWKDGVWDLEPFEKSGVKLVFFAPRGADYQTSHDEDEFYFIARGSGKLVIDGESFGFDAGDVFFVPAGVPHHFGNFSEDFATWAVFF